MTSTPTASAVNTDLADRLLTESFVVINVKLNIGPGARQLSWEAIDVNRSQRDLLKDRMGAKAPTVHPFPELKSLGQRVKSSVESFQDRWTVQSGPFRLYPQSDEENVAVALLAIQQQAAEARAQVLSIADAARQRWRAQVSALLSEARIADPFIAARLDALFPSDARLVNCLHVSWTVRVIESLENQAEQSVQLQETTARARLHRESERQMRQAVQDAADAAADEVKGQLAALLGDLRKGAQDKPMNGQRRQRLNDLASRLQSLSQCFTGSESLLDVASQIRRLAGGVGKTHKQGSEEFKQALAEVTDVINAEIKGLNDPTKRGHRSIAQFIQ